MSSSAFKKAFHSRAHKERSQPLARAHLGLLEKKKDYKLRAKDYNLKQKRLKALREKASMRNQDEFYFKMVNSKTKGGVHVEERNQHFDHDFLTLLKTQDQNYVNYQRSVNQKKLGKMESSLHFFEGDDEPAQAAGGDRDDAAPSTSSGSKSKATHTVFVDDEDDVKQFDAAEHFQTPEELLGRKFNRPTYKLLEEAEVQAPAQLSKAKMTKQREGVYREILSRTEREEQLRKLQLEQDLQKALMGKGARKKVGHDKRGLAIYKWRAERKK
ncbi:small-subunit processome [Polychytrium aggregatum]|uniref:small-subunit processome n=1 Tax=Polychytrium aggregatum TaxID=110093 RepID=UPI0022FECC64|nr:small-subunit processome [Polychytrium aggregatum]KAI9202866.1 small-subunit processome [Polychytrium aggregatum]